MMIAIMLVMDCWDSNNNAIKKYWKYLEILNNAEKYWKILKNAGYGQNVQG